MDEGIAFAGSPLDRAGCARRERGWIREQRHADETRFLPLWKGNPLVKLGDERTLAWARRSLFESLDPRPDEILLGLEDGIAHFAIDVSSVPSPEKTLGVAELARFEDLRAIASALPAGQLAITAHARSLVDWHARHGFCAVCGEPTRMAPDGSQRSCTDCGAEHFPRTDPVAIAIVSRGDRCLLGRSHRWPESLYSALAGFVEPGETIEEAVRREVWEEVGVIVGAVRYLRSQPWPFPSSLMIGCLAEAKSDALEIDPVEIADARWVDRDGVRAALAAEPDAPIAVPPPFSLAHHLMRAWLDGS